MPVYRRVTTKDAGEESYHYELAGGSAWKRSDARDVTKWFEEERTKSGDASQFRHTVRLIKKFARSRDSWGSQILSGFGITKLVAEKYRRHSDRHDEALYYTMEAIRDRLALSERVEHPVTPNETITSHPDGSYWNDPKRLSSATSSLTPSRRWTVSSRPTAPARRPCSAGTRCFGTTYFVDCYEEEQDEEARSSANLAAPAVLSSGLLIQQGSTALGAVRKEGGGRHA